MRRLLVVGLAMIVASSPGCTDPSAPAAVGTSQVAGDPLPRVAAFPPCTKHWKNPVSGVWSFGVNWKPAGVPAASDVVCLDAAGSYTVTSFATPTVEAIIIGGGAASPTLRYRGGAVPGWGGPATWAIPTGIDIRTGVMQVDSVLDVDAGYIHVGATLLMNATDQTSHLQVDSLVNDGQLVVQGTTWVEASAPPLIAGFRNTGSISVATSASILGIELESGSEARMEGGSLTGLGGVEVIPVRGSRLAPIFVWSGGTLPASAPFPQVTTYNTNVRFGSPAVSGAIWAIAAPFVTGEIGAGVTVYVSPLFFPPIGWQPTNLRSLSHGPLRNLGTLKILGDTIAGPGLLNDGTLVLEGAILILDSLVNTSSVTVTTSTDCGSYCSDTSRIASNNSLLRNRGTVTVSSALQLDSAEFYAEPLSRQTGPLVMKNGTLAGIGSLGSVTSIGGRIEPGPSGSAVGGLGTLTFASLTLDLSSAVGIDLAGTGVTLHDNLVVTGQAHFAGNLTLREQPPFVSGTCGQVIPVILDGSSIPLRGGFGSLSGAAPGPGRGWRLYYPTGSVQIVGHDPALPVSRSPAALTVAEGGGAASYSVCLRSAPLATVNVASVSAGGQLTPMAPLSFFLASWALPKAVAVSAVNDLLLEPPPQTAMITHLVTSADPAYTGAMPGPVVVTILDNEGITQFELQVLSPPPVVSVGSQFTVSLRYENAGPDASVGASFTTPPSAGYTWVSSTGTLGCTSDAIIGTSCQLGSLASGAHADFTLTFQAVVPGIFPTTYTVTTIQTDPNLANNTRSQTITVN